jgi:hypothetical protein
MSMQVMCAHLHLPLLRSSLAQSSDINALGAGEAVALATAIGGLLGIVVGESLAAAVGPLPTAEGNGFAGGRASAAHPARSSKATTVANARTGVFIGARRLYLIASCGSVHGSPPSALRRERSPTRPPPDSMAPSSDMASHQARRPRGGIGFTTWGPLLGACGHLHLTVDAAEVCLTGDRAIHHASTMNGEVRHGQRLQSGTMLRRQT